MGLEGLRLELGMELAAQIPGVICNLAYFDVGAIWSLARNAQPARHQEFLVLAIELVAMPMPLADLGCSIGPAGEAALLQQTWPGAEPHRAAQLVDTLQFAELVNHTVRRTGIELARIRAVETAHVAGVFDHHGLHPQADAEIRDLVLARVADRVDHALDAALAETAGHQDAVVVLKLPFPIVAIDTFGFDPVNIHMELMSERSVYQGFLQALVGVLVLDILAYQSDRDLILRVAQN